MVERSWVDGLEQLVVEGMVLAFAARTCSGSRIPALARARRGSADLGDRDATPRPEREHEPGDVVMTVPAPEPWLTGAAWTAFVVMTGFAVRGALTLV